MMRREVKPGQFYRHFKNHLYQIVAVAIHSETREQMVVYQALYGDYKVYVRPYDMFVSEVDHVKYPEIRQRYRFEQVEFVLQEKEEERQSQPTQKAPSKLETAKPATSITKITSQSETSCEKEQVNPDLMRFLEADSYEDKIQVLQSMKKRLTPQILQTIAISMDYSLSEGNIMDQYESVMYYLETRVRYEGKRLR